MKTKLASFLKRLFCEERGQAAYLLGFGMFAIVGTGGLTVDVSHAYLVRSELQVAANAAALASVNELTKSPLSYVGSPASHLVDKANQFSASANGYNYDPSMGTVTTTVATPCLTTLLVGVSSCSDQNNMANAVKVTESVTMPTYFMRIFGIQNLTMSATATAQPRGITPPYNIAIILDGTPSMNNTDTSDPACSGITQEQCALNAMEGMLANIVPCINAVSCTASSQQAGVRVSFFTFPNIKTTDLPYDEACSGSQPAFVPYTFPKIPPAVGQTGATAGYQPISYDGGTTYATYQISKPSGSSADPDANGFSSDFYPGSGGYAMNTNSTLVKIMGNTKNGTLTSGCMREPVSASSADGSYGQTYFAGAIYAAQAALQAEKPVADALLAQALPASGITSTNVIIFVSDGQANASAGKFPEFNTSGAYISAKTATTSGAAGVGGYNLTGAGTTTYTSIAKNLKGDANSWGVYPDFNNNCQQAITAAQYAASQGTHIFAVSYGSESDGCLQGAPSGWPGRDGTSVSSLTVNNPPSPLTAPTLNIAISAPSTLVPCVTIEDMAFPDVTGSHFYADTSSVGCTTTSANPTSDLNTIFSQKILGLLGPTPRLIPNTIN